MDVSSRDLICNQWVATALMVVRKGFVSGVFIVLFVDCAKSKEDHDAPSDEERGQERSRHRYYAAGRLSRAVSILGDGRIRGCVCENEVGRC